MTISMDQILAQMEEERLAAGREADEGRDELRTLCMKLHITKVDIAFSGGGDSGQIDDVAFETADGFDLTDGVRSDLTEKFSDWSYTYLTSKGVDWYNNDGGQGNMCFDMTSVPFKFSCNIDVNETVSSTAFETEEAL
jgi:hypothetical protein